MKRFWQVTRWARALRFWLFVILAVIAWVGIGEANAAACGLPNKDEAASAAGAGVSYPTVVEAVAACNTVTRWANPIGGGLLYPFTAAQCVPSVRPNGALYVRLTGTNSRTRIDSGAGCAETGISWDVPNDYIEGWSHNTGCPADTTWNPVTSSCDVGCSARDNLGSSRTQGSFFACSDGCQFEQDAEVSVCLGEGADMYCFASSWKPTGNQCDVGDPPPLPHNPNEDTCRSTGNGWSECVKPNGDHCVTGAKGTRMCWQPGEAGQKNDTANIEWADRKPKGETPTPPSNIENPTEEMNTGDKGGVSGGGVGGSFVVGGGSGTGNKGGQNNTGSGGSGPGGSGDGDGDEDGPGAPGNGVGDLYEGSGDTVESVVGEYVGRISSAPIINAATGFLTLSGVAGSCPIFSVSFIGTEIVIDFFCRPEFAQVYHWMGWFMMALFAWAAFRVGVLD